jgi:hypothetical protein
MNHNPSILRVIGEMIICVLIGVLVVIIFAIGTGSIFPN